MIFTSAPGPVVSDDLYLGESFDARLLQAGWDACGFLPARNTSSWLPAAPSRDATQNATLSARHVQIRVDRDYPAVAVTQPMPGVFVVDFAQNVAGLLTTRVTCAEGPTLLHYVFGESLNVDGTVYNQYTYPDKEVRQEGKGRWESVCGRSGRTESADQSELLAIMCCPSACVLQIMRANFTCAGTGEEEVYTTQFSQYGFRFVQVTGYPGVPDPSAFTSHFVHSDVEVTGSFETDNPDLDFIQHATIMASLSNLMDVPSALAADRLYGLALIVRQPLCPTSPCS